MTTYPDDFEHLLKMADSSWHSTLREGLEAVEKHSPNYLAELLSSEFLPSRANLFAAFSQPVQCVRYVLVGEGPYPRADSANGYCFMDAAVESLWVRGAKSGLSKQVNRATSLRNFMKMLLVAERHIRLPDLNSTSIAKFVQAMDVDSAPYVQTMADLQTNFLQRGFLLLNASLVFRSDVAPAKDAKAWSPFLERVFARLVTESLGAEAVKVILWGKIPDRLLALDCFDEPSRLIIVRAEHPYNLSFISNTEMHALFEPLQLLSSRS